MSAIVNNNTSKFLQRYEVNFDQQFKKELRLLKVKLIDKNFFIFAVNKSIDSDCENTFMCESGEKVKYEYIHDQSKRYTSLWICGEILW